MHTTPTANDVHGAIIRARTAADTLQRARAAMLRDHGDETAPSWPTYVAALDAYYTTQDTLAAMIDARHSD